MVVSIVNYMDQKEIEGLTLISSNESFIVDVQASRIRRSDATRQQD